MKGPTKMETYTHVQTGDNGDWASGMTDKENNGETIRMKGSKGMESYDTLVQQKWAAGMTDKDTNGETIRLKGPKNMESYDTLVQIEKDEKAGASRPNVPLRGEKQW